MQLPSLVERNVFFAILISPDLQANAISCEFEETKSNRKCVARFGVEHFMTTVFPRAEKEVCYFFLWRIRFFGIQDILMKMFSGTNSAAKLR